MAATCIGWMMRSDEVGDGLQESDVVDLEEGLIMTRTYAGGQYNTAMVIPDLSRNT